LKKEESKVSVTPKISEPEPIRPPVQAAASISTTNVVQDEAIVFMDSH